MRMLALDIGTRRTGVAYGETDTDIVVALDTIAHTSETELADKVSTITKARKIEALVVGLPLLPGGGEGAQSTLVREAVNELTQRTGLPVTFIDERYTTVNTPQTDKDAKSACEILEIALQKRRKGIDI